MASWQGGGRNPGANSLGPDSPHGVTQQAIITAQYDWNVRTLKNRIGNEGPDFMGRASQDAEVVVRVNEPFFVSNGTGSSASLTGFSGEGTTSFNGISIRGVDTDDGLWDRFSYMGHTHGSTYSNGAVTSSGVAVGVRGSHSYPRNYGPDEFTPGDLIALELPSVNPRKRAMQLAQRPKGSDMPCPTKLLATPRRFDAADLYHAYRLAAADLISQQDSGKYSIPAFRRAALSVKRTKKTRREESAAWRKQDVTAIAYSALMTAYHLGYIRPSYGAQLKPSASTRDHQSIYGQLQKLGSGVEWWTKTLSQNGSGGIVMTDANAQAQRNNRHRSDDFAKLMATSLGLATTAQCPWLQEDHLLVKQLLVRHLGSSSGRADFASASAEMVSNDFAHTANITEVFGASAYNQTIRDQVRAISADASDSYLRAVGRELDNLYRRIAGTATNRSRPGGVLHVAV